MGTMIQDIRHQLNTPSTTPPTPDITTTTNPPPHPRTTRTPHPKVRSGCLTCKKRRVKCDELRPSCARCLRFGIKCDGYNAPRNTKKDPKRDVLVAGIRSRPLMPRGKNATNRLHNPNLTPSSSSPTHPLCASKTLAITHTPKPSQTQTPPPTSPAHEFLTPRFLSQDEARYFRLFVESTAVHLSGYYEPTIWGRIVLQAAESSPSIRHAVISIGALDMTSSRLRSRENGEARRHHVFALRQYQRAIRDMRDCVEVDGGNGDGEKGGNGGEGGDLQRALVGSVLIVCFETYHGNYRSAAQQIRTGVRLIEEARLRKRAAEGGTQREEGIGIEPDLVRAFDRLDVQSMSHSDPFTLEEHIRFKDVYTHTKDDIPTHFTDLKGARNYFNFISRRCCHFASMAWKLEYMVCEKPSHSFWDPMTTRENLAKEHGMFVDLSEQWMISFQSIFGAAQEKMRNAPQEMNKSDLAPLAMRNHFLAMRLALRHFQDIEEVAWDKSVDEFVEMLENAEMIIAKQENEAFSFDLQSVWPLDVLAKKCRVSSIRRRAVQLLKNRPRREGIWDSVVAAMVCDWVVNLEEEGRLDDGTIPESARARNIGVDIDSESRTARVWCFVPGKYGEGLQKCESLLEWGTSRWNFGFGSGGCESPWGSGYTTVLTDKSQVVGTNGEKPKLGVVGVYFNAKLEELGLREVGIETGGIGSSGNIVNIGCHAARQDMGG